MLQLTQAVESEQGHALFVKQEDLKILLHAVVGYAVFVFFRLVFFAAYVCKRKNATIVDIQFHNNILFSSLLSIYK